MMGGGVIVLLPFSLTMVCMVMQNIKQIKYGKNTKIGFVTNTK